VQCFSSAAVQRAGYGEVQRRKSDRRDAGGGYVVIEGRLHGEVAMRRDATADDTTARDMTDGGYSYESGRTTGE